MASEGSREIEAAKLRLAAAKTQKESAAKALASAEETKKSAHAMKASAKKALASADATHKSAQAMLDTATRTRDDAASQLQTSQKEVKAAESFLKEAEKRWEVIEIDADEGEEPPDGGRGTKKRKVSLSPDARTANVANADGATANGDNESLRTETVLQAIRSGKRLIVVEGAGRLEANGIYKQSDLRIDGAQIYCKSASDHVIFHREGLWRIGTYSEEWELGNNIPSTIYMNLGQSSNGTNPNASTIGLPPERGWISSSTELGPAPRCRRNQHIGASEYKFTVCGCGTPEVNGTYVRQSAQSWSDGVPAYRMEGQWEGKACDFLLWRQLYKGAKAWFISSRAAHFYYTVSTGNSAHPPMVGWEVLDKGLAPAPTLWNTRADELARGISGISVRGSGMPEVNGMYHPWILNGVPHLEDDVPVFRKSGQDGNEVSFVLRRNAYPDGTKNWMIRAASTGSLLYATGRCEGPAIAGPPGDCWGVLNGATPPPKLKAFI